MPAYVIVDVEVRDATRYERYKELAAPAIAHYGGQFLARGGAIDVLEGEWVPERLVILEFPSLEHVRRWYDSAEYAEARALREATTRSKLVAVEGLERSRP